MGYFDSRHWRQDDRVPCCVENPWSGPSQQLHRALSRLEVGGGWNISLFELPLVKMRPGRILCRDSGTEREGRILLVLR